MKDMASRCLTRRAVFLLGAGAALGALGAGESGAGPSAGGRVRMATVSSGAVGFLTHVITRRKIDAGYGLSLDLVPTDPAAAEKMVLLRQVEAGLFPIISAARIINEGQSFSVFGPLLWNHNYGLTYADRPYRRLADLKGKRIATLDTISSTYQSTQVLAAAEGVNFPNDFHVVTSPAPAVLAFLQRGDVEGIIHFEPNIGNLLTTGKYKVFMDINAEWKRLFGQRMFSVGLAAHDQWINQHRDVARRLVQTILAGARAIHDDPTAFQQYADYLGLDTPAKIKAAQERMPGIYPTEWTRETVDGAELVIRHALKLGILEKAPARRVAVVL
jgi:NitT/TauT family transport system substrate-binding protein